MMGFNDLRLIVPIRPTSAGGPIRDMTPDALRRTTLLLRVRNSNPTATLFASREPD